ncbi:MAG: ATP-binding cassette domain-containing protein [Methanobrevibacter sp.]|jgi:molybdopterin-binding protein|nr:ATP-binding cassette domain-containing protein [Candidatus Methanovirga australis]
MFLEVKDLSVDLREFKLKDINLSVEKGEYLVLIGPTGSGKSVLLETIIGFYSPDNGEIYLNGEEITNIPPENRGIGIVYQDNMLFPHMNVYENIAYGGRNKIPEEELEKKVKDLAKQLKIDKLLSRDVTTLSGGEAQRTSLARALIANPKIILMDEPFSALDITTRTKLRAIIKDISIHHKTSFIHVSHNFNDVWNLADTVGVMKDGKIHQLGTVSEVFSKPENNFVADFVGVSNILKGKIVEIAPDVAKIELENGTIISSSDTECMSKLYGQNTKNNVYKDKGGENDRKDEINDDNKVLIAIRPENIIFSKEKFQSSARNQLKGKIIDLIKNGPNILVKVDVNKVIIQGLLTANSADVLEMEVNNEVYLSFKSLNVKIIDKYHSFEL